jgi:6,7-dimethyl-8-ribityllumazine synthase
MRDASAGNLDASSLRIGVAVSRYHCDITDALAAGARDAFTQAGGVAERLTVVDAPGSWELTAICRAMALLETRLNKPMFDALVALGCILTGETTHDQYIAQSITQGLTAITVETGMPIAFGVLTCQTLEQAQARAATTGDGGGKGAEAMRAAIAAANALREVQQLDRSKR